MLFSFGTVQLSIVCKGARKEKTASQISFTGPRDCPRVQGTIGTLSKKLVFTRETDLIQHFRRENCQRLNKFVEDGAISFTTVRHPFESLVSAYHQELQKFATGTLFEDILTKSCF